MSAVSGWLLVIGLSATIAGMLSLKLTVDLLRIRISDCEQRIRSMKETIRSMEGGEC